MIRLSFKPCCSISLAEAEERISLLMAGVIFKTSNMATLPKYPEKLHSVHPLPRKSFIVSPLVYFDGKRAPNTFIIFSFIRGVGSYSSLHVSQMRLAILWATEAERTDEIRNGSPPKSMRRGIAVAESLVWRVENTR